MNIEKLKPIVRMGAFVKKYVDNKVLSDNIMLRHKMRGVDGNGKDISFSTEEKKAIKNGMMKFLRDIGYYN